MDPQSISAGLEMLGVPPHIGGIILAYIFLIAGICATLTKWLPPPVAEPVSHLGKFWKAVYPAVNWLGQNSRYAANRTTPPK